jgi:hypothetical protein
MEYKYVTSRNIVFNHAFESKGGVYYATKQMKVLMKVRK